MNALLRAPFSLLLFVYIVPNACAAPIIWAGNGHYYELIIPASSQSSYTWTQANAAAESMSYLGSQGHLASVMSAAENNFLRSAFASQLSDNPVPGVGPTNSAYAWIGLFAPTPVASFQWTTGEAVAYTNWAPTEPNFFGSELWQFTHYWTRDFGSGPSWTWNNEKDAGFAVDTNQNRYGFIVEFDGPFFQAVPEPTSIALFGMAFFGLIIHTKRRCRVFGQTP